ncbi:putative adhesin domain protein, partial [Escherichia coli 8-415-05_S3_C3]
MAHIGDNPVAVDLSTVQYRIPTTVDGDGFTAVCCGFSPLSTVTFL